MPSFGEIHEEDAIPNMHAVYQGAPPEFWFYTETGKLRGPFSTVRQAAHALNDYIEALTGYPPEAQVDVWGHQ